MLIAWNEKGVCKDSTISFFAHSNTFKQYYYYVYNCGSFRVTSEYEINREAGFCPLLMIVMDGSLKLEYEKEIYSVSSSEIVLLDQYHPHHYWCEDSCSFLFFHFNGKDTSSLVKHLLEVNGSPVFSCPQFGQIAETFSQTYRTLIYHNLKVERELSIMVYEILCQLENNEQMYVHNIEHYSKSVGQAISYFQQHVHENVTLTEICDVVHLSPYYFTRLFKKETGYTPVSYLSNLKISLAKLMLRTTNITITQIADSLGYSSDASFINAFKLRTQTTPAAYRNRLKAEERSGSMETHNAQTIENNPSLTAVQPSVELEDSAKSVSWSPLKTKREKTM